MPEKIITNHNLKSVLFRPEKRFFTSESVTEGHPDKICDQVSDAVLDAILEQDPDARVACETAATTGLVLIMGEITTTAAYQPVEICRDTIRKIGYDDSSKGFDANTCGVIVSLHHQSPDIALGVDRSLESRGTDSFDIGAGDQGMVFGFAVDQTPELMPLPIALAHRLSLRLSEVRKNGTLPYLRPDGKTQVTVEYLGETPVRIDSVVVSSQHSEEVALEEIRNDILNDVIRPVLGEMNVRTDSDTKYYVNPTGRFVIGGPNGDSGLTGRKIIVDTYGGYARHGGGAFSGKDPTKVDRSGAYIARYIAKNIVAAGAARRCEIQIAYAIGVAKPLSVLVNTHGTGILPDAKLAEMVNELFDLRPAAIISTLDLRRPIYSKTASYGHFGKPGLPWESVDRVDDIRAFTEKIRSAK